MAINKINIEHFIEMASQHPVFDVRSPSEYIHAHYPNAFSLPIFTDEERKIVGTAYKQQGKQPAIKIGLDFFGIKMKGIIVEVEAVFKKKKSNSNVVLVHCWRGGMRSAGVAWLLDLYGYEVYLLEGGYKNYRNWVLSQFDKPYQIKVLGGYTGSSKTELLKEIENSGESIIDLEGLANHKGSAFGGIGQLPQPSQEMFENKLANSIYSITSIEITKSFWVEDESQRIGIINIPHSLWKTIRNAPLFFIEIPFEERLEFIIKNYGVLDKSNLINAVIRIQKRLGPLETKTTVNFLLENNIKEAFDILLKYYDKNYIKAMYTRENIEALLQKIPMSVIETKANLETVQLFLKK